MQAIETERYKGLIIAWHHDQDCSSPRENDNLGTIIAWHRRYRLSDDHAPKIAEPADFNPNEYALCLPVFMYEHGGVALSTGAFSCPWDSGQVGWIFVERAKLLSEYSSKRLTRQIIEKATSVLKAEIEEYSSYVNGECYGYVISDEDGEQLDSCWGHIGYQWAQQAAREAADSVAAERLKRADEHTDAQRSEN